MDGDVDTWQNNKYVIGQKIFSITLSCVTIWCYMQFLCYFKAFKYFCSCRIEIELKNSSWLHHSKINVALNSNCFLIINRQSKVLEWVLWISEYIMKMYIKQIIKPPIYKKGMWNNLHFFVIYAKKNFKENHKEFLHNILSYSKEGRIFSYATTPAA